MGDGDASLLFAGGRRRDVPIGELSDWVTENGRHVVDAGIDELPIGADVAIDSEFVPDAIVVDTPGVGGLNPSHLRLAVETARAGSVLLMTCDVSAPICGPELAFLDSVSAEIETVVIAVTKIDKSPRGWRSIVEENKRLLKAHTRFGNAPIIGVSNVRARAALQMDPGEQRDKALASSGLPELAAVHPTGTQFPQKRELVFLGFGVTKQDGDIRGGESPGNIAVTDQCPPRRRCTNAGCAVLLPANPGAGDLALSA